LLFLLFMLLMFSKKTLGGAHLYINLSFGFTTACAGSIFSQTSGPKVLQQM
jgi:hypothetical protein